MSIDVHQKISADHLRRDAFLYVRQSSLRQGAWLVSKVERDLAFAENFKKVLFSTVLA